MLSQPGLQAIAIHILPNISQSKVNQTMKIGELIRYDKRNIFSQTLCRQWAGRLVPDMFCFFQISLIWGESKWSAAWFQYISIAFTLP